MSDIQMPDGLTTPDIPISTKVNDLVNLNTRILDSQEATSKKSLELLSDIYSVLQGEAKKKPPKKNPKDDVDPEEEERQNKFFTTLQDKLSAVTTKIGSATETLYDKTMPMFLGQWNLLLQPLSELTGFDPLASLKKGVSGLFGKKASKKPSAEEVAKGGFLGAGFLYLGNILTKNKGGDEEGMTGKFGGLADLLKGGGGLAGILGKGLGIGAIIASIVMMIADGIQGFKLSDIWGTSKIAGVLGAVLGGVDKGIMGALKGAGKWALMGAGIGSIVPGIGTLIGGIVGAVFGAVMGFVGGENLAKAFDAIGSWFKKLPALIASGVSVGASWVNEKILQPVWSFITSVFTSITSNISQAVTETWDLVNMNVVSPIKNFFIDVGKGIANFTMGAIDTGKNLFDTYIFSPINGFFTAISDGIKSFVDDPTGTISKWMDNLVASITGFFSKMTAMFDYIGEVGFFKGLGNLTKASFSKDDSIDALLGRFLSEKSTSVNDAIITKDGQIIHTDVDDNIIATKNSPREVIKMDNVNNPTESFGGASTSKVEVLLQALLDTLKSKDMSPVVVTNNGSSDLEAVRKLGS